MSGRTVFRTGSSRRRGLWRSVGGALAGLLAPAMGWGDEDVTPVSVWLNPGAYSHHFDRTKPLRDNNAGVGVEVRYSAAHAVMAGTFINSNDARSRYVGYLWRPLRGRLWTWQTSLGIAAGAFDGYPGYHQGAWFPALLPVLSVDGARLGLNIYAVPEISGRTDAAVSFQLTLKVW